MSCFVIVNNVSLGYDTHASVESQLNNLFSELNGALYAFSEEMKSQYIWNNVTVVQTSDFGRTLNPNGGGGTDHGWGGNYLLMGMFYYNAEYFQILFTSFLFHLHFCCVWYFSSVYFLSVGGSVKGGQVLGEYPDDFSEEAPLTLVRGK